MAIKTVGIIGVGAMGRPMGGHLLKAGYAVVGCDLDENARRRAGEQGLRMLASPGDVARESDLVIVVVGFDAQVEAVMYGEGGIMGAARPGLTVGIGATIAPSYARGLAERVAASTRRRCAPRWCARARPTSRSANAPRNGRRPGRKRTS